PSTPSGLGYNDWELGYDAKTGYAPGYVGTGPFMMVNGSTQQGYLTANKAWELFANPYYFVQYTNASTYASFTANNTWATPSLWHQYTPKIAAVEYPYYSTLSGAVTAMSEGLVQTITEGVTPSFVPVVDTFANTYIFHKSSSGYGYMQLNSYSSQAPMNITAFRQALNYATDKAYLATVIDSGYDILGQPIIPPSDPLWRNDSTPSYSYNPAKAEALIASIPGMVNTSGVWYYNGNKVTADIQITSAGPNPLGVEGALVIAQEWGGIGVPTTVTQESFTTLIPNLENYNYNVISLGITGIAGDPTGDYFAFYNYNLGNGTGFYLGPWSNTTFGGKSLTGAQVNDTMNNLTLKLNSISSLVTRTSISDEIQGLAAVESTMINLGYGIDILPFTNTTFTNISEIDVPYTAYMYWAVLTTHT
ncbi:Bacterial extracellular solute-binding protein, family 5, partial [mine drainage metagenome]